MSCLFTPHSSTLAWKIPWMEEPGRLQSMGSLRVGHNWATSLSCIGEGNGNAFQCSCLENPRDREAWWAAIYGVAQSWTRRMWLSSSSNSSCTEILVCFSKVEGLLQPFSLPVDFWLNGPTVKYFILSWQTWSWLPLPTELPQWRCWRSEDSRSCWNPPFNCKISYVYTNHIFVLKNKHYLLIA